MNDCTMQCKRPVRSLAAVLFVLMVLTIGDSRAANAKDNFYTNPLPVTTPGGMAVDSNNASVLLEPTPKQDYVVETRVRLNLPAEGCCYNYVQAGLVIYKDDDNFIKLAHVSIWETRQTEFAKELAPVPDGYPRYGNSVIGPPDEWTYLRIARAACGKEECYTGYTSRDGVNWMRGGTWTHVLGDRASIGLVAMGGTGFTAEFDYVRTLPDQPDAEAGLGKAFQGTRSYSRANLVPWIYPSLLCLQLVELRYVY